MVRLIKERKIFSVFLGLLLLTIPVNVKGEVVATGKNYGSIEFYQDEQSKPNEPNQVVPKPIITLPKTSIKQESWYFVIGLGILFSVLILFIKKKSKKAYLIKRTKILLILVCLSTNGMTVAAERRDHQGGGQINYQIKDNLTPPVDPEKPEDKVQPEGEIVSTKGLLRLDFVPELKFGSQMISSVDQSYEVQAQHFIEGIPPRGNYVQVTDNRGNLSGWRLGMRQEHQFKIPREEAELTGAVLSFDQQWANSIVAERFQPKIVKDTIVINEIGTTYPLAIAEKGRGMGTWVVQFGSSSESAKQKDTLFPVLDQNGKTVPHPTLKDQTLYKNEAVRLIVPGKTKKEEKKYQTTITWILAEITAE